jgi:hypothetical protein
MKILAKAGIAAAFAVMAFAPVNAVVIPTLFNTGVDASGVTVTGHVADLHWHLSDGTAYTGGTAGAFPQDFYWLADNAASRWLSPTTNAADDVAAGVYIYSTTFLLTGFNLATASISGQFLGDNSVTSVLLNGVQIASGPGSYSSFTAFSTALNFVADLNTLTFVTYNADGPGGVRVEVSGTADAIVVVPPETAVPEPATWALMLVGFGMVGFTARRRRIATVAA